MDTKKNQLTDSEKLAIAIKAANSSQGEIESLANTHGVTVEDIKTWMRDHHTANVIDDDEEVTLEASDTFADAVNYGVTKDVLNYNRLTFWTVFGTIVLTVFVISIISIFNFTQSSAGHSSSEASEYFDLEKNRETDQQILESFGVVDPEAGIYRIPIDSAITIMSNE